MAIRPLKRLGQNFLRDPNVAAKIAAAVVPHPGQSVVEIGAGEGALTKHLLTRAPQLTVIEIDARAVEVLRGEFPGLDIIHADVLDVDWYALAEKHGGSLVVVGNLPYNITSPILFGLLDAAPVISEIIVMMQLEVAQRLVAVPRTKEYGSLSVGVQLQTTPRLLFKVSRNVFHPKPNVTSAVVRLQVHPDGPDRTELERVRTVVRTAFNQRRKTLRNSLSLLLPERTGGPAESGTPLHEFEVRFAAKRAEELTPADFVDLTALLQTVH